MAIFKEKKPFAFVDLDNKQDNKQDNLNEFISSGAGDKKIVKKSGDKRGRPKSKQKLAPISLYLSEDERAELTKNAEDMHMSLSAFMRFKLFSKNY
ncbi:hypothetical protein A9K75_09180 [Campylobacter fetus subsp. testudinum]|uniref:hypothetical protein n=1 Tax=Campylobacter fetus TaxID=196 RepID=UPI000818AEF9|nr:hypothetical protein [Campylobacter fetus]OCR98956.1 hypothetical protein A9K75_09180 [Campylobacter fetus subsp. testudinum]